MSNPEENQDKGTDKNKTERESRENPFKILDDLLAHTNKSRQLFLIFIGATLFFAPISLVLGGVLLGHPKYNIDHLEGSFENDSTHIPLQGVHLQLVSQNGTVIREMPPFHTLNHLHRIGFIFLWIRVFIVISIIFAGILLFIAIKEYRFFSKWNTRYTKFKSLQDKIDEDLKD